MTRYYDGGKVAGQGWRTLEPHEIDQLAILARDRAQLVSRNRFVVALYEDGVAAATIAQLGLPRLGQKNIDRIIAAWRPVYGRGLRRSIPRDAPNARPQQRRPLAPTEQDRLLRLDAQVPRYANGTRALVTPSGRALAQAVTELHDDKVALATLGGVLGVTREAVRQMIGDYRRAIAP